MFRLLLCIASPLIALGQQASRFEDEIRRGAQQLAEMQLQRERQAAEAQKLRQRLDEERARNLAISTQSRPPLKIEGLMSQEELQATGILGLTPSQRSALDRWLSEYTLRVIQLQVAQRQQLQRDPGLARGPTVYPRPSGGHWIESNSSNGAMITL